MTQFLKSFQEEQDKRVHKSRNRVHGLSDTKFHYIWRGMKQRTLNPKCKSYKYYGARGIRLCKKWESFAGFKEDMYKAYLKHCKKHGDNDTSIDRTDNNKGYSKENCTWVTKGEQTRNNRNFRASVCKVCPQKHLALGYCHKHYQQFKRHGKTKCMVAT